NQGASGFDEPLVRGGWGLILDKLERKRLWRSPKAGKPEVLADFRKQGLMISGIAYNKKNKLGSGCMQPNGEENGLTELGKAYIRAGKDAGVAIDLCHLNEKTTLDAAKYITDELGMPPLITHTDCFELRQISRNATDDMIRSVVKGNGVVGISS